jgi:hypothetical protein
MFDNPADVVAKTADFFIRSLYPQVGLLHLPLGLPHSTVELGTLFLQFFIKSAV